jgi:prepilin-type N-terminal cleavage/methylation domain-containing protein
MRVQQLFGAATQAPDRTVGSRPGGVCQAIPTAPRLGLAPEPRRRLGLPLVAARRAACRRSGFTLIEIVLAAGLLAIGLSALLGLFSFGASLVTGARLEAQAAQALESLVPDLPGQLFALSPEGQVAAPVVLRDRPVPGYPRLTFDAIPSPVPVSASEYPGPPLWAVEVTVAWKSRGQGRGLSTRILLPQTIPLAERLRRAVTPGGDGPNGS